MTIGPDTVALNGRVAIVTGAAQGIGQAISLALANFGADVAICDRNGDGLAETAKGVEAASRRVQVGLLDVRDADAAAGFLAEVKRVFETVDVLVNNAGGGFFASFLDVNEKGQDALVRENFSSVTHFVRGVVPLMPESGGSIINITSIEAHRAGPGYAVYSAMKAAVASLTKSLALELGPQRIRVNCIAPDVIPTPGIGDLEAVTPLDRRGHVDDCAGAAVFLASDLSRFVTGTTLHVDGGNLAAGGWHRRADGGFST